MINHFQHLERYEGETFGPALVLRGARERLSPILMTALATGLAVIPLAIAGDLPGHEIEHPMAVVIVGGLITSTFRNLFIVPVPLPAVGPWRWPAGSRSGSPERGCVMRQGMEMRPLWMTCVAAVALILVLPACGERGHTAATSSGAPSHRPISAADFDPALFGDSTVVDNRWFPLEPGTQMVWEGHALDNEDEIPRRGGVHGHRPDEGHRRRPRGRHLGARLHRRLAGRGRACLLRPGCQRERVALRRVPGGIRGGQDRQDPALARGSRGREGGGCDGGGSADGYAELCAGLGPSGRLERPGGDVSGGPRDLRPRRLLQPGSRHARVQSHRTGRVPTEVLRGGCGEHPCRVGRRETRKSARCWC